MAAMVSLRGNGAFASCRRSPAISTAKPPAETKKAPAAAPAGTGLYYVQVAAFAERAQAQALADRFKAQGYTTVLSTRTTSTKTWYRVRLGGFKTRDQAAALLGKLNAAAGKKTDYQIVHD
jgi:cell division septation protein DedD